MGNNRNSESFILLLISIRTNTRKEELVTVFWDSGATVSFITFTAAETLGLIGNEAQIKVTIAGGKQEPMTWKSYLISLVDVKIVEFNVYRIDRILTKVQGIKLDCVLHLFKNVHEKEVQRPNG